MISSRFSCLPFIVVLPLLVSLAGGREEKADPKWDEILGSSHDGASCHKRPDGDVELRIGKSNHEEIIRYHREGSELKSVIVLLRYYPLKDQRVDSSGSADFEIFRVAVSGKERKVFHLEGDGQWKEVSKPELSGSVEELFPIALNHLDDEATK